MENTIKFERLNVPTLKMVNNHNVFALQSEIHKMKRMH